MRPFHSTPLRGRIFIIFASDVHGGMQGLGPDPPFLFCPCEPPPARAPPPATPYASSLAGLIEPDQVQSGASVRGTPSVYATSAGVVAA